MLIYGMPHHAKKSLGQNFLKSKEALRDIVAAGNISATDVILEIGPGKGVLTEQLLQKAGKVIAVEKDTELVALLTEKFKKEINTGTLELITADILTFDPTAFGLKPSVYKIIANIPYYITGAIIEKFLTAEVQPERMVLLLQKEVAKRIVAHDEKESILSISVKAFGTPKYIGTVKAKYFSPAPKVDSAILLIENISHTFFNDLDEQHFFSVVKAGFAHKRKMLMGNLKKQFPDKDSEKIFSDKKISPTIRAEDISLTDWKEIAKALR
jgi:16S rRNA (adenine1518-N6/adenine1519-N6)-dimethyltransferase